MMTMFGIEVLTTLYEQVRADIERAKNDGTFFSERLLELLDAIDEASTDEEIDEAYAAHDEEYRRLSVPYCARYNVVPEGFFSWQDNGGLIVEEDEDGGVILEEDEENDVPPASQLN